MPRTELGPISTWSDLNLARNIAPSTVSYNVCASSKEPPSSISYAFATRYQLFNSCPNVTGLEKGKTGDRSPSLHLILQPDDG